MRQLPLERDERECIAIVLGEVLFEEDNSAEHSGRHCKPASFSRIFASSEENTHTLRTRWSSKRRPKLAL